MNFFWSGEGEEGEGQNALWATGNTDIYYCVFCYPKLRVGAVFTGMRRKVSYDKNKTLVHRHGTQYSYYLWCNLPRTLCIS